MCTMNITIKITVSTVGLVPEIREWVNRSGGKGQLAVSLHATTDEVSQERLPSLFSTE